MSRDFTLKFSGTPGLVSNAYGEADQPLKNDGSGDPLHYPGIPDGRSNALKRFKELRNLTGELDALGEQLEARKTIDRAKGLLIDECGMREQEAFSFIQRTAMSERTKMRDVADRIIDGSLRP